MSDNITLTVGFGDDTQIVIDITGDTDNPQKVIAALRKIGQTDYLLALYDELRGISHDEDEWEDDDDY